ncbi:MAG: hypothetical protein OHK0013_04750 [Sandaracinaceae bacterium]
MTRPPKPPSKRRAAGSAGGSSPSSSAGTTELAAEVITTQSTPAGERATSPRSAPVTSTLDPWSRYWLAPVAAVRPWLLLKATLLVLAFDVLHTHLSPAWRYGAAGFNVPHFAWLAALPQPTATTYVGMLFVVSTGALVAALLPSPPRWLLAVIGLLYTWGWACSMLDSYQHHYLLGLVLLLFALFPRIDAHRLFGDARSPTDAPHGLVPRTHALGYTMLTSLCAVVYAYTARAKTEPDWLSGDAMRNITRDGQTIRGAIDFAASLGIEGDDFWWWLGHGVVPVQIVCALGYALSPLLDGPSTAAEREALPRLLAGWWGPGGRWSAIAGGLLVGALLGLVLGFGLGLGPMRIAVAMLALGATGACLFFDADTWRFFFAPFGKPSARGVFATLALLTALSFHVGAEYLALEIGWFSLYMIATALLVFLPARWLSLLAFVATTAIRSRPRTPSPTDLPRLVVTGLAGAASLVVMGQLADLPGAVQASVLATAALVATVGAALGGRLPAAVAERAALACVAAGIAITGWLAVSPGRFDYYRFAGGDFRRRLDYEAALDAYQHANRYAPPGQSRDDRVEEMRALVRERRGLAEE